MFQQIWAITRKELRIWAQKPGQWIILFLTPLVFIWIMGAAFGAGETPTVAMYAADEDHSPLSADILGALQSSPNLEVTVLESRAAADRLVSDGQRMVALIIPAGFGQAALSQQGGDIELIIDPARAERAAIVKGLVKSALADLIVRSEVNRGVNQSMQGVLKDNDQTSGINNADVQRFAQVLVQSLVSAQVEEARRDPLIRVDAEPIGGDPITRPPSLMESLVPGYTLMFAFFLVSTLAESVMQERATGTLRRLLSTPAQRRAILAGKMLPFFLLACVQFTVILWVSHFAFGVGLGHTPLGLALVIISCSATIAALGIFIAAIARSQARAGSVTNLLVLMMSAVSGSLFPEIRIPFLEYATPHYWAIQGFQNIVSRGMGLSGILLPVAVLSLLAAAFFTLGVLRFRFD